MKGICFKEPLFNLTIKGIKTQTRRIISCPKNAYGGLQSVSLPSGEIIRIEALNEDGLCEKKDGSDWIVESRHKVNEIVFLKEPYCQEAKIDNTIDGISGHRATGKYLYKFSGEKLSINDSKSPFGKWKNKLFMTAESARYSIKITEVRAERLQEISNEDCVKEGIIKHISNDKTYWENGFDGLIYEEPRQAYEALINLINGKDTWKNNPFVWVYDYELTTNPKDHE